jgi:hypothetical protein
LQIILPTGVRAEQRRAASNEIKDVETKEKLYELAATYDRIAAKRA